MSDSCITQWVCPICRWETTYRRNSGVCIGDREQRHDPADLVGRAYVAVDALLSGALAESIDHVACVRDVLDRLEMTGKDHHGT